MNNTCKLIATGAAVLAVIVLMIYYLKSNLGGKVTSSNVAYYSADDGVTFFRAAFDAPPYRAPDGRPAFPVQVFSSDGGTTKFVGYLMRATSGGSALTPLGGGGLEVKKPGPGHAWVPAPPPNTPPKSPEAMAYQDVVNPPTPPGTPHPISLIPEQ